MRYVAVAPTTVRYEVHIILAARFVLAVDVHDTRPCWSESVLLCFFGILPLAYKTWMAYNRAPKNVCDRSKARASEHFQVCARLPNVKRFIMDTWYSNVSFRTLKKSFEHHTAAINKSPTLRIHEIFSITEFEDAN